MPKKPLRDIVVVIPGITGSVLQRDDKDVWAMSGGALWGALTSLGGDLRELELKGDGDDGVVATKLMPGAHVVPGLVRIDGYAQLVQLVEDTFEIVRDEDGGALNLIELPYDWRRDNRLAARRLDELVEQRLPAWRRRTGAADAKVIVLAHSMGGLVARYWIECLGGWKRCKALLTLGTPHRGSPNAIGYLANGYKKLGVDLTRAMRSFPSVHQLLPRYEALSIDGGAPCRVGEVDGVPGVDAALACDGLAFHREIEDAVADNDARHGDERYALLPFVGARQPTIQSAKLVGGKVTVGEQLPAGIDPLLADGDGTVPRASAIPIELSDAHRDTFVPERHGSLQANEHVLADVRERLVQLQVRDLGSVRAAFVRSAADSPALSVDVADAFTGDEPVTIGARLLGAPASLGRPHGRVAPVGGGAAHEAPFEPARDGRWRLRIEDLPDGLYRLEVGLDGGGAWAPPAVHELFGVAREQA